MLRFFFNNKGKINGRGTYSWPDGKVYTGQWRDGLMNGSDSIFTWLDGRAYEGGYKDDKKHGWGSLSGPAARSGGGTGTRASSMGMGSSIILKTGPV
jgi:hypothetical protein